MTHHQVIRGAEDMKDWQHVLQKLAALLLKKEEGTKYYDLKRYFILREIQGVSEDDPEVLTLQKMLVQHILSQQLENGSWNNKVYNYQEGTTHQVMNLVDLGLDAADESIKKAVDYMFTFQAAHGPFIQDVPSCGVEANLVVTNAAAMALSRAGYADDLRVKSAYEWLCTFQQDDGSWLSPNAQKRKETGGYPYCYCGLHATCNILRGVSASKYMRTSKAAHNGAEYLLQLCGFKYPIEKDATIEPPLYRFMGEDLIPFEGAWYDPRIVPPEVGPIPPQERDRKIEVWTTQHVLGSLCVLGYGLDNEKVRKGHDRLLQLVGSDITMETIMALKGLHESFSAFSFHGH